MRIVHLVDDLDFGGLQQIVAQMSRCLAGLNHSVSIVCLRHAADGVSVDELRKSGVKVLELHKPGGPHLPTLRQLTAYLREQRTEVLNSHNHLVHHYAILAGRAAGVPAVVNTLHGTATLVMQSWAKLLFWASCMASDRVICVSPEVHDAFSHRFALPRKKLCVVVNGIELGPFLALPRPASNGAAVFGNVGRMVAVKDHQTLLEAFAIVLRQHPQSRLRLLGGGPLESRLRKAAQDLNISESVDFCGFSRDIAGFLSTIDIFVSSSLSEGLPLTLLEAMGAGLPVVSTAVGGIPGVVQRTGGAWLCPPGDPTALAEAMQTVVHSPDRLDAAEGARQAVCKFYSVDRMASDYIRLYTELLQSRG